MLAVDEVLATALRTHQEGSTFGVARYLESQQRVELSRSGQLRFNGSGQIQAAGTVEPYGVGNSFVPKSKTDPLATYGQEMSVYRQVRVRQDLWSVPLGVYRITRATDMLERLRGDTVTDWSLTLSLKDRFEALAADDFFAPEGPVDSNSIWQEIRRLSPFPVQEALSDGTVPAGTVYRTRFDAIATLMDLLGGVPHMTREGVVTARLADAWLVETTPVFDIEGTIEWSDEMTNSFYNQVRVTNPSDPNVVGYASLTSLGDPLSVSRAGGRTYHQSSPIYETADAAQAAAETILARVSTKRSRQVRVACTPEALLLDLGDYGRMFDPVQRREVVGEVTGITVSMDPTMPVQVDLIAAVIS